MSVMSRHIALNFGFKLGHLLATCHQIGDFLAAFLALLEICGNRTADQNGKVVAHRHGMRDLMGDENHRQPALFGLIDDA